MNFFQQGAIVRGSESHFVLSVVAVLLRFVGKKVQANAF